MKSILLSTALRRQAAVHREAFGVDQLLELAKPYHFQSTSPVNYLFNDASSISYISRNKPFRGASFKNWSQQSACTAVAHEVANILVIFLTYFSPVVTDSSRKICRRCLEFCMHS